MRLDAFNVSYSNLEDRLLLQAVGDGAPQNFWVTRRAASMLGEGIQKVLAEQCARFGGLAVAPQHVGDVLSFDHEVAVSKNPPTSGKLVTEATSPPLLLFQISYLAEDAEYCTIQLTDQHQNGHSYHLAREMLHALLNLIQSHCDTAGWGIQLSRSTIVEAGPKFLH